MKKLIAISFLLIAFISCSNNSQSNSDDQGPSGSNLNNGKRYQIESGIISYKMDMMGMETKMTVYFKEYGKIEASLTETEMMGEKTTIRTLQKNNNYYTFTPGKKTGTKFKMDGDKVVDETGMHKMSEADILKMGGKKIGKGKVLDKECIVYQMSDEGIETKVWIWHNLFLKTVASQNGMQMSMEAIEIKETSKFPSGIFDVPANIIFTEPQNNTESDSDFDNPDAKG